MRIPSSFLVLPAACSLAFFAGTAHAQQDNAAAVEALFSDGKKLMAEGKTAEACPKFLASYNLEHRVGTVLNLAACYEKNGQIASAWARFVEAQTLAARGNQPERAAFAAQHATALEPRKSTLVVTVSNPPPGLVVRRDGIVVDPAVYGVAVPVDGGAHTIEASAPGKTTATSTVTVGAEKDAKTFALAPLADAPVAATAVSPTPSTGRATPASADMPTETHRSTTRTVVGLGIAGVGVIAAGIGAVFGAEALSKNSQSNQDGCVGNNCPLAGYNDRNTARSDGNISSILIGVGAAAIVGGVVVWLTAPKTSSQASASHVVVGLGPTGMNIQGTF